jgi:hypothetical protein
VRAPGTGDKEERITELEQHVMSHADALAMLTRDRLEKRTELLARMAAEIAGNLARAGVVFASDEALRANRDEVVDAAVDIARRILLAVEKEP